MRIVRIAVLSVVLAMLCWFEFAQDHSLGELWQIARDRADLRPARSILILGNSRTYGNGMPDMLRHIADSAGAPQKYEVLMIAPGGSSLQSLIGNWRVEREIGRDWDDAIVQGESRGQSTEENRASFLASGINLIEALHPHHARPLLIVNWAYDRSEYPSDAGRADHYRMIQETHADLAARTGAHLVNVGKIWEVLPANLPGARLTLDGNHPTVLASYFLALCLYTSLSGSDATRVQWAPPDIPTDQATELRKLVSQYRAAF
jgi:hypothetical protein